MPTPFEISMGPPYAGMNSFLDPRAIDRSHLADCVWADTTRGTVKGYYQFGTFVATLAAHTRFACYVDSFKGFISGTSQDSSGRQNWACRDAHDNSGNQVVYATNIGNTGTINDPVVYYSATMNQLGLEAPTTTPGVVNGSSGGSRAYSYTFKDNTNNYESNPWTSSITVASCVGAQLTGLPLAPISTPPHSPSSATHIGIYGTNSGTTTGDLYYLGQIALGTTTFTDTGANGPQLLPLRWGPGGTPKLFALPADHSPAPLLTCMSDGLHSAFTSDVGATGLGILFGAVDNYVCWSMLGKPYYWPTVNWVKLPYTVQAIVTRGAVTYAFTEGGVWLFTGVSDTAIQVQRSPASLGILLLAGKTVAQTPYGVVYLTREGPTLINGVSARPLCSGLVDASVWNDPSATIFAGAYQDGLYHLQVGSAGTFLLDLRNYPNVAISRTPVTSISAFVTVPYASGGPTPGLYVVGDGTGHVDPWSPILGSEIPGATPAPWAIETARSSMDAPGKLKRCRQVRVNGSGVLSILVNAYKGSAVASTFTFSTVAGHQTYRLPAGFEGTAIELVVSDPVGNVELYDLTLIGEVLDGD